jgi:hypothetical protein
VIQGRKYFAHIKTSTSGIKGYKLREKSYHGNVSVQCSWISAAWQVDLTSSDTDSFQALAHLQFLNNIRQDAFEFLFLDSKGTSNQLLVLLL